MKHETGLAVSLGKSLKAAAQAVLAAGILAAYASPAAAQDDPFQISFTLEGCRGENLPAGFDLATNNFLCDGPDFDAYTTGNMGKTWNELDVVPHRVTVQNNNGPQTYRFVVAGDYTFDPDSPVGWDFISEPVLNPILSDGSCSAPVVGPLIITLTGGGVGGADQTIFRTVDVTQSADQTCVYDYVQRLAIGASTFSGSSLQSNLWNQSLTSSGIGQKRLSIPVNDILPQLLSKTMSAEQDADHIWTLTKEAQPVSIGFGDTCEAVPPDPVQLQVTVTWTRSPTVLGEVTVMTEITATNPAARDLFIDVTDDIFGTIGGMEILLGTAVTGGPVLLPKNSSTVILSHTLPGIDPNVSGLRDVATATYTDIDFPHPILDVIVAEASTTIDPGTVFNQTAVITDTESITGTEIEFSADSFAGAGGAFIGYTAGDMTLGPVDWESVEQNSGGSVTFFKTVYADMPSDTSEVLSDTATITTSGNVDINANASTTITTDALVDLEIVKNIPDVVKSSDPPICFDFNIDGAIDHETAQICFNAGETSNSTTVFGLEPDIYTVSEDPLAGWISQPSQMVDLSDISLSCQDSVTFNNEQVPGTIIIEKVTEGPVFLDPFGTFGYTSDIPLAAIFSLTTTGAGAANGDSVAYANLVPGTYTVTEDDPGPLFGLTSLTCNDVTGTTTTDENTRVASIDLAPGETVTCTYTNNKLEFDILPGPGGDQRTIGYWRNWNTCTNGNQAQTAAKNGGAAEGFFLVDDFLNPGVLLGDLLVDNCEAAVSILRKRDIDTNKKKAKDAAYSLAAQLLAAQYNYLAGAGTCLAVQKAMTKAQNLLASIDFDGIGDYLQPGTNKKKKRRKANRLAKKLDGYNNGDLCS